MILTWEEYHALLEDIMQYGSECTKHGIALGSGDRTMTTCHEAERDAKFKAICEKLVKCVTKGGKYGVQV